MALSRFNEDVEIITKLGDVPGSDDGLSTQQLKSKFDLAAVRVKNFINNILIPSIENAVDEDSLLSQVSSVLSQKLSLSGGTMTGAVNMNGKRLYNIKTPTDDMDATPKGYVDNYVDKYVDKAVKPKIEKFTFSLTLPADRWVGTDASYTQSVAVEGILETDAPYFGPRYSTDGTLRLDEKLAFSCIDELETGEGSLTFTCFENKPVTDLTIQMEVFR